MSRGSDGKVRQYKTVRNLCATVMVFDRARISSDAIMPEATPRQAFTPPDVPDVSDFSRPDERASGTILDCGTVPILTAVDDGSSSPYALAFSQTAKTSNVFLSSSSLVQLC